MVTREEFDTLKQETAEMKNALMRLDKFVATLNKENAEGHQGIVNILDSVHKRFETQQTAIETLFAALGV